MDDARMHVRRREAGRQGRAGQGKARQGRSWTGVLLAKSRSEWRTFSVDPSGHARPPPPPGRKGDNGCLGLECLKMP